MSASTTAGEQRVIRVFVSSTFRDMQAERDELVKRVFPQLRKLCEERGAAWSEVDLRWGITEKQSQRGEVLPICLAEIERCRPYFIGLLGERYGWVPDEIPAELIEQEPWLKAHLNQSVTELEILHGVLNDPQMAGRSFFYFRDRGYIDSLPAEEQADYLEHPTAEEIQKFGAEEAERRAGERRRKLESLKDRIRTERLPVREGYADPRELGQWVLGDMTEVIDRVYPKGSEPDPLDREAIDHEAFAESRGRVYIGRQGYYDRLNQHAQGDGEPLVVLGESGSGKSALLANWAMKYRRDHPDQLLLMHFIGATPYSADWAGMARRIMVEFKRRYQIQAEIPDKVDELRVGFANWLHMAGARGRVVLILDGLNQLEDRDGAPDLVWLPPVIPGNIRLIVSTLPGRPLDDLKRRGWPSIEVEALTIEERQRLIPGYLFQYSKQLSPERAERIAKADQTANPLYLRALLDELRVFGIHEQLDARIEHYLTATTVENLYEKILERYEQDYERERPGLVKDAMSMLWAARRGLSESELLELLGTEQGPLPRAHWSPLYLAAEASLVSRSGLIGFGHDYLREAVRSRYLSSEDAQVAIHLRVADYFALRATNHRRIEELPWQLCESRSYKRLIQLLSNRIFFSEFFDGDHCDLDMRRYWSQIESDSEIRVEKVYLPIIEEADYSEGGFAVHVAQLLVQMGRLTFALYIFERTIDCLQTKGDPRYVRLLTFQANIMADRGELTAAMHLYQKQESYLTALGDLYALQYCIGNQGIILRDQGNSKGALKLYKRQESICRDLNYGVGLQLCLGNQALALWDLGDLDKAARLLQEQQQMCRELGEQDSLSTSLGNMGEVLMARGEPDQALRLFREQETICQNLGYLRGLQASLLNQAAVFDSQGDDETALKLLERQAALSRDLGDVNFLAMSLMNQALILSRQGNSTEALQKAALGQEIAIKHGLTRILERYAPLLAFVRGEHAAVAAVILDLPSDYQRQIRKRSWRSLAMLRLSDGNESCYFEEKLKIIPPDWLVVLVTAEETRLREYLVRRRYDGRNERSYYFCAPPASQVRNAYSPDDLKGEDGKPILVQEGSLSCFRALTESGVFEQLLDRGIRYLHISFMGVLDSAIDLARLGQLIKKRRTILAEVVPAVGSEGPYMVKVKDRSILVEREQIPDQTYKRILENPQDFPFVGNNTYWVSVPLLLKELGITRGDLTRRRRNGDPGLPLDDLVPALRSTVWDGTSFEFVDRRLSSLTHLFDTMFFAVPPRSHHGDDKIR